MVMLPILRKIGYVNAGHSPEQKVMIMLAIFRTKRYDNSGHAGHSPEQKVMIMLAILQNKRLC
jgi:hypothetical protein